MTKETDVHNNKICLICFFNLFYLINEYLSEMTCYIEIIKIGGTDSKVKIKFLVIFQGISTKPECPAVNQFIDSLRFVASIIFHYHSEGFPFVADFDVM